MSMQSNLRKLPNLTINALDNRGDYGSLSPNQGPETQAQCEDLIKEKCSQQGMANSKRAGNGAYTKCDKLPGVGFKMTARSQLIDENINALVALTERIEQTGEDFYRKAFAMPDFNTIQECLHDRYNSWGKMYSLPDLDGVKLDEFFYKEGVAYIDRLGVCVQFIAIVEFLNAPPGIYHTDLKPENIMVVKESSNVFIGQLDTNTKYRVSIIDMEGMMIGIEGDTSGKCSQEKVNSLLSCIMSMTSDPLLTEAGVMWSRFKNHNNSQSAKPAPGRSKSQSAEHAVARSKSQSAEHAVARSKSPSKQPASEQPSPGRSKSPSARHSLEYGNPSSQRSATVYSRSASHTSRSGSARHNPLRTTTLNSPHKQDGGDRASLASIRQLAVANGRRPPGPKTAARAIGAADRVLTAILESAAPRAGATTVSWRDISSATERLFPDMDVGAVIASPPDAMMLACASKAVSNSGRAITAQSMKRVGSIYAAVVVASLTKA